MIDLRSDTVTKPSPEMREAMAGADVGDDVYGEDPTVARLEARVAELLGKDEAVFVPTGTMSNQIAIRTQTQPGDRVLVEANAHIVRSEGGAAAAVSGVTLERLESRRGLFTEEAVDAAVGVRHRFMPATLAAPITLLCVENTHNGGGGTVWPLQELRAVCAAGRRHGLSLHLDGARLWHASAASGVPEREYAEPFDTVNVCFSKGLGAPLGSALVGSSSLVTRARRFKQQLGGGMRQAGVVAAGALYALENHRAELGRDVRLAATLARGLAALDGIGVVPTEVDSNIVRFEVLRGSAATFADRCFESGVHVIPFGAGGVRAVVHRDVGEADVGRALDVIAEALAAQSPAGAGARG